MCREVLGNPSPCETCASFSSKFTRYLATNQLHQGPGRQCLWRSSWEDVTIRDLPESKTGQTNFFSDFKQTGEKPLFATSRAAFHLNAEACRFVRRRGLSDSYLLEGGRHTWRHSASPWSRPIDRRGWWNDAYVCFELVEIIGRPVISFSTALEFLLAD
jgi:hypothetical protein